MNNIKVNFDIYFSEEEFTSLKLTTKESELSVPDAIRKALKIWLTAKTSNPKYTLALIDENNAVKIKYKNI